MLPQRNTPTGSLPAFESLEKRLLMSGGALIITNSQLAAAFQQVADWYTRKGYPAEIVTLDAIYSQYSGVDSQERIRNCIRDYHDNEGVDYVLLGGDDSIVPDRNTYVKVGSYIQTTMPTDLYYASLEGTWDSDGDHIYGEAGQDTDVYLTYDVIVGRYPVRTAEHVTNLYNKVVAYETTPPQTDWATEMLAAGVRLWNSYGAGTYNGISFDHTASDAEIKSLTADAEYVLPYWSERDLDIFFDSATSWDGAASGDYSLNAANLSAAMSNGYQFMQMSTHGNYTLWGLESGGYSSGTVSGLSDPFDVAIVSTMACNTGGFDAADPALSEAFLRSPDTGTIVYLGCSRYGWGYASTSLGPSLRYSYQFYKEFLTGESTLAGEAFAASKEYFAPSSAYDGSYRWVQFGLNFQGDPMVQMYRTDPVTLDPVYASQIDDDAQTFTVSGLTPGARVCLWQGEGVYEVGEADGQGEYSVQIDPETGELLLTVIAQDAAVYTGTIDVGDGDGGGDGGGGSDEIIVDNQGVGFATTGLWLESYATDEYVGSSLCSYQAGATATWTPQVGEAGWYDVYAWWSGRTPDGQYNRDSTADYVITHAGGTTTVTVDQDVDSGQWVSLGRFGFEAGDAGSVTLVRDGADWNATSADAIRLAKADSAPPSEYVVDNQSAGFSASGAWLESYAVDEYANSSVVSYENGATATWSADIAEGGYYEVYAWWSGKTGSGTYDRDAAADYTITRSGGTTTVEADQNAGLGRWVLLGTFELDAGVNSVTLTCNGSYSGATAADAVRFLETDGPESFQAGFDFGTAGSPVADGHTGITEGTAYSAALGHGWQCGGVSSRDRGVGTEATRDFNFASDSTFGVDVANGTYEVTVTLGDARYAHDYMGVYIEGANVAVVSTGAGEFVTRSFQVDVADGQLNLRMKDLGGNDPNVVVSSVEIARV